MLVMPVCFGIGNQLVCDTRRTVLAMPIDEKRTQSTVVVHVPSRPEVFCRRSSEGLGMQLSDSLSVKGFYRAVVFGSIALPRRVASLGAQLLKEFLL